MLFCQPLGQYIQRLSDSTQFLVISHRKGTIEAADVLCISMGNWMPPKDIKPLPCEGA